MSDSLIAWKPRIDEPSKPRPSSARAAVNSPMGTEKCWVEPIRSVNRTSTTSAPAALALRMTSARLLEATPAVAVVLAFAIETSIQSRVPAGRPSTGMARALIRQSVLSGRGYMAEVGSCWCCRYRPDGAEFMSLARRTELGSSPQFEPGGG